MKSVRRGLFWAIGWILFWGALAGCAMGESVAMQKESDSWSTKKLIYEASVAKQSGRDRAMYEYILKAGFRWQYERVCFEPTDEVRESIDSAVTSYLSAGASVLGYLRRNDLKLYAEILSGMEGWKLVPMAMDGQTHYPDYEYKPVNSSFCEDKGKELQGRYDQFHENTYALFSNKEYQELNHYIIGYEQESTEIKALEEDKYLDAVNRKMEIEEKYDFVE